MSRDTKCNWCGKTFTTSASSRRYCSDSCRKLGFKVRMARNNRRYYLKKKALLKSEK